MHINTEGIIFRQTKTADGRKMLLLFTRKYGKISVGTSLDGRGKKKSSLALRPFTYGEYQIFQGRNYYNLDRAETRKSWYALGEDLDKYMAAAFVLELTEKVVPEETPQPALFQLLIDYLGELSERKKSYLTLVLAYEVRMLKILGLFPSMDACACCGSEEGLGGFSVSDGGMLCADCVEKKKRDEEDALIYHANFDIVEVINYFAANPLTAFRKLALEEKVARELQGILRAYLNWHLDVGDLKSESVFAGGY